MRSPGEPLPRALRVLDVRAHARVYILFKRYPCMVNQVRAAHILIPDEKKAKDLKAKIDAGEDFADLAKKWSHCPSKKKGGDLGWFKKGDMVPEFEAAAFAAKTGDVVGPVKTQFGWHIIKILGTK